MTGISEILVLILLILCILIVPRMLNPAPAGKKTKSKRPARLLTMKTRAAIVLSVTIISVAGLLTKPWQKGVIPFLTFGILPVGLGWAIAWIISAKKS